MERERWDISIREISRLYEEMYYRHSDQRGHWLYKTVVTDSSVYCNSGGPTYLDRSINKQTSAAQPTVSDDWNPAYRNGSIGAQTYHVMRFGDAGIVLYCVNDYKPFF